MNDLNNCYNSTNDNTDRTHLFISLSPPGNNQRLLKCVHLIIGMEFVSRVAKLMIWSNRLMKKAITWDKKRKAVVMREQIKCQICVEKNFDWDNSDMDNIKPNDKVKKLIQPVFIVEISGIKVESD